MERDRETYDLKIAIDARAHEISLCAVCGYREEEQKEQNFNHKDPVRTEAGFRELKNEGRRIGLDFFDRINRMMEEGGLDWGQVIATSR